MKDLAIIVQCRLSSTRFPQKALKDLGGKTVFQWVLDAMKKVPADWYYVATDSASMAELKPIAEKCGWNIVEGPLEDVLDRYCMVIKKIGCKTVLRATADNPFLFYEAAASLVEEYRRQKKIGPCDYITWTGLPHGCGVEVFDSASLLKAASLTKDAYDHEHVGPAIYNHKSSFTSLFFKAPARFFYPDFRTTIDTPADYRRALAIVNSLSKGIAPSEPYTTEQIVSAIKDPCVRDTVLFYPCTKKGFGTGHLRRCLSAALESGSFIYIPENSGLEETESLLKECVDSGLKDYQIVRKFPEEGEYSLVVLDSFSSDKELLEKLRKVAVVASIDEGSPNSSYCDYLIDIIPSYNLTRSANIKDTAFMELPKNRKNQSYERIEKVLVCLGGEDPAELVVPAANFFADETREVTAVLPGVRANSACPTDEKKIKYIEPVKNLKEELYKYDLVVTHYGLTAFEAVYAGCAVVLLATSRLHENLAKKYGFLCLSKHDLFTLDAETVLEQKDKLYSTLISSQEQKSLGRFVKEISHGKKYLCPICRKNKVEVDSIVARTKNRTFRRCSDCGILYVSWNKDVNMDYGKDYFAQQYKNQYGKTYLEDFDSIKKTCTRRVCEINGLIKLKNDITPSILDIGCAYGPFLAAAAENGWHSYGTDVSKDAIEYVRNKLLFPAVQSKFPEFDAASEFGINRFDAISMWYVIEHFSDLKSVLQKVNSLLRDGGIFAFSTPSASGVSAKKNTNDFFEKSPADHFTLWEPSKCSKILKKFGFKVVKIVSTGHHPERFPMVKNNALGKDSLIYKMCGALSVANKLGDTFEVYCKKVGNQ